MVIYVSLTNVEVFTILFLGGVSFKPFSNIKGYPATIYQFNNIKVKYLPSFLDSYQSP